jgi:Ca2+:H+ antiporter
MARWWWLLSGLCILAVVGDHAGWPGTTVFVLAGAGTIAAAALLGRATEEIGLGIAAREVARQRDAGLEPRPTTTGAKVGGLLNATFGNVPELFIGILALNQGYITLTKATIAGSVIGNAALVLGMALFAGGVKNGTQRFDSEETGHHAVLMALAVTAMVLPSLFLATTHTRITEISLIAACLLLMVYVGYLLFSIFQLRGGPVNQKQTIEDRTFIEEEAEVVEEVGLGTKAWPITRSVLVLAIATLLIFGASEALIDTVKPFTADLGWSPLFVGIVVVPILGNMAEHYSAIMLALKNRMNASLAVASGSSIQVALFVAPILVLASQFRRPMSLVFNPIEIAVIGIVVVMFFFISQDGESNWLEGLQLLVLYAMAAAVFFFVPSHLH